MNMQLNTAPHNFTAGATKPIKDIKLPNQASTDQSEVSLVILVDNVQFDDGSVSGGYNAYVETERGP